MRFEVTLISGIGIGVFMDAPRYIKGCKTLGEAKAKAEAMYPQACGVWQKDKEMPDNWVKRNGGITQLWLTRGRRRR